MTDAGKVPERTVWVDGGIDGTVRIIDQTALPFRVDVVDVSSSEEMRDAIAEMIVRGAGCIGACGAYGVFLAVRAARHLPNDEAQQAIAGDAAALAAARPTAVNLTWAVQQVLAEIAGITDGEERVRAAWRAAERVADDDVAACAAIGRHGLALINEIHRRTGRTVNVMTHCNAGWLAFVQHGTATAPMYAAHDSGVPIHVWVSETRPRNQGARLTAWELTRHGVPNTLIPDNAAGHLMQHGDVDLVIVGSDRTTRRGDVANKVGTYLKAVAAHDNAIPFYVALPSTTIDPAMSDGTAEIPIEQRDGREVTEITGVIDGDDHEISVRIAAPGVDAANYGFDVTPARLVTGLITERGICAADESAIVAMYPEFGVVPSC